MKNKTYFMIKAGLIILIGSIVVPTGLKAQLFVEAGGSVGVGTHANPTYKLHVDGDVKANNFISATKTYPDYVFDSTYQLLSLKSVEAYIKLNHHLPDVPSENEVKKAGINLASHQVILLKKVEELTLYAIDQNKKLQELEEKLNAMLEQNNKLKEEVKDLKKTVVSK